VVAIVVAVGLAPAVVPAFAANDDETLVANDFFFDPDEVTIAVGDTVTFTISPSSGNVHNFSFQDGPSYPDFPSPPGDDWKDQSRTFTTAGRYEFVCNAHPFMTGAVNVVAVTPTPTPTVTATATPTVTATPTPTPTPDPTGTTIAGSDPLEVRTLRVAAASFCTKRGGGCANPGVKVRIDLSASARVTGTLTRRPPRGKARAKRFGRVDFGTVAAGARTLSFTKNAAGKRLTAGRYQLKLTVTGGAPRTLSFRVR
jgi:plastocyanin